MITKFPLLLLEILQRNKRSKLVIILDGIDKLEDKDHALDLLWLPKTFPPEIRMILSCTPDSIALKEVVVVSLI